MQHVCSEERDEPLLSVSFVSAKGFGIDKSIGTRLLNGSENPVGLFEGK
jgi:hypothetical protein